jgi:hypothetical protein
MRPARIIATVIFAAIVADHRFPQIFVIDHAVAGVGASGHGTSGGGPIPPAARRAITHALTDVGPLTFVTSGGEVIVAPCAHVRDDGILITLGPVDGTGDRVPGGRQRPYGLSWGKLADLRGPADQQRLDSERHHRRGTGRLRHLLQADANQAR